MAAKKCPRCSSTKVTNSLYGRPPPGVKPSVRQGCLKCGFEWDADQYLED